MKTKEPEYGKKSERTFTFCEGGRERKPFEGEENGKRMRGKRGGVLWNLFRVRAQNVRASLNLFCPFLSLTISTLSLSPSVQICECVCLPDEGGKAGGRREGEGGRPNPGKERRC